MVGPSAAELESLKELIHFDHEYFKVDSSTPCLSQTKSPSQSVNSGASSVQCNPGHIPATTAGDPSLTVKQESTTTQAIVADNHHTDGSLDQSEPVNVSELDLASFLQQNMDSLMDLEALLVAENEPMECDSSINSEDTPHVSQYNDTSLADYVNKVEPVWDSSQSSSPVNADILNFEDDVHSRLSPCQFLQEPFLTKSSVSTLADSGYGSEISDVGSPASDSSAMFGDQDGLWEESFTELFPSLA